MISPSKTPRRYTISKTPVYDLGRPAKSSPRKCIGSIRFQKHRYTISKTPVYDSEDRKNDCFIAIFGKLKAKSKNLKTWGWWGLYRFMNNSYRPRLLSEEFSFGYRMVVIVSRHVSSHWEPGNDLHGPGQEEVSFQGTGYVQLEARGLVIRAWDSLLICSALLRVVITRIHRIVRCVSYAWRNGRMMIICRIAIGRGGPHHGQKPKKEESSVQLHIPLLLVTISSSSS